MPENIKTFEKDETLLAEHLRISKAEAIASICEKQNIHSLVIQDILDVNHRPKFQEYYNYSFLTLKSIVPFENDIITEQISLVFGPVFDLFPGERPIILNI